MDFEKAKDLIGENANDDYILDLKTHHSRYESVAPALAEVIQMSGTEAQAEGYHRFDAQAIEAANEYKDWMNRANIAAFLVAVLSAAAMAWRLMAADADSGIHYLGPLALSIAAALAVAVGAMAVYFLRNGTLLKKWMGFRAQAETFRLGYFQYVCDSAAKAGDDATILALEYFNRYQFDVQRNYLHVRAQQHRESAKTTLWIGGAGAAIAAISSVIVVTGDNAGHAMGALTVLGAALGSFAIGREQMTQDQRNAERYDRTYDAMTKLAMMLDVVRPAVANGNHKAALEFVAAVNDHISNEHRQWLDETEATQAAVGRIEAALNDGGTPQTAE